MSRYFCDKRHYFTNVIILVKKMVVMKKRLGTKLYNTDTAILVLPEKNLYRQSWGQTYFFFDGKTITPVDYEDAEKIILESNDSKAILTLTRKADKQGDTNIRISAASADRLALYCRQNQVTQKKVIEDYIDTLPIRE